MDHRTKCMLLKERLLAPIAIVILVLLGFRPLGGGVRRA